MSRVFRYIRRGAAALGVTLVSLVLLCLILIYMPPVQKLIADKVLNSVSQDMEFSVSIGDVSIGFPLDIHLEDVQMVRKADGLKMIKLAEANATVSLKPLFDGIINADSLTIYGVEAETDSLIPVVAINGQIGSARIYDADWNLDKGHLSVMTVALDRADMDIMLNDSVPEDTTEEDSESVLKVINVGVLSLNDISCHITLPSDSNTLNIGGKIGCGVLSAMLDLEEGKHIVRSLDIDRMAGKFTSQAMAISVDDCNLELPELVFHENVIRAKSLDVCLNNDINLNAKDIYYNLDNGDMSAGAAVRAGNLRCVTDILPPEMLNGINIPDGSMLTADVQLRNKDIAVRSAGLSIGGAATIELNEVTYNMEDGSMSAGIKAEVANPKELLAALPQGTTSGMKIPAGLTFCADFEMSGGKLTSNNLAIVMRDGSKVRISEAEYDIKDESYNVNMDISRVFLSQFIDIPEQVYIDGHVKARGRGFDFLASGTRADASICIDSMAYGIYNLTAMNADVKLGGSALSAHADIADTSMKGVIDYDGLLTRQRVKGQLDLNIGDMDLKGLGFSDTPHNISTYSTIGIDTDLRTSLKVDAGVMGMNVRLGDDSIMIDEFVTYINASDSGTSAIMYSGDMDVEVRSPLGYTALLDGYSEVAGIALNQLKTLNIDASKWKAKMPEVNVSMHLGTDNPIANLSELYDVWFDGVDIDARTSPEVGVECECYLDKLTAGGFSTDIIELGIQEDSASLNYNVAVSVPAQADMKPFSVKVGGFLAGKELQTRLHYIDEQGREGVDLGLRAQAADTMLCMDVYPYDPIIGYRQFEVSDTNYINLHKKNRIFADVSLNSLVDSCKVSLHADPATDDLQNVHLLIDHLDLSPMMAVLPFMPSITGMVDCDMSFVQGYDTTFSVGGDLLVNNLTYEGARLGDIGTLLKYNPMKDGGHQVFGQLSRNNEEILKLDGKYHDGLDARLSLDSLPLDIVSALAPDLPVAMEGKIGGVMNARGETDAMHLDGFITPMDTRFYSKVYSLNIGIENDTIAIHDSKINFNQLRITSAGKNKITLGGEVDLSDIDSPWMNVSLNGRGIELINSPKTRMAELYGKVNGDIALRAQGTTDALDVRGRVKLLNTSDVTYIMKNTALSMGYRLDDIVTFVRFDLPPDSATVEKKSFPGLDMNMSLEVEQGAKVKCIFSADEKSYVDVRGGGTLTLLHLPEGIMRLTGRYTIDKGEMRYANSVIPLKTFTIQDGSYIEFTGEPSNPKLSLAATERVRASVSNTDKSTRMVTFNTGIKISNTLQKLGLEFTLEAPEDMNVQQELASMTAEEKNKIALSMLATGMYLSGTNDGGFNTTNALNNFLQGEINNLAGKALNSVLKMDMNLGMEQTSSNDGDSHTDYSFRFSKRLFSDRLSIAVGGIINTSGVSRTTNRAGTYIDDVSLEWRLDKSSTQYVRLFHGTDFNNLLEGVITENGVGIVLRKKVNDWKDLWKLFQIKR